MNNITKRAKNIIALGDLAALLVSSGCTIVGTVTGPFTGAVDSARRLKKDHDNTFLVVPGAVRGLVLGPFSGFAKGLQSDVDSVSRMFYNTYTQARFNQIFPTAVLISTIKYYYVILIYMMLGMKKDGTMIGRARVLVHENRHMA